MSENNKPKEEYAIRFGLGAIKAVGIKMMEKVVDERKENGESKDIFDFAKRVDPKSVNKKSIEALAKSGAFDSIANNRHQIHESYDRISAYSTQQHDEANSNQMTFFGELIDEEKSKPQLKNVPDWDKNEKLQKEFEAFGFFLLEHPLDDLLDDLRKRGCVFSEKIEIDEFDDGDEVKFAGVIAATKHRSSAKGRFAYGTVSDPFGIYEIMIFDEELITQNRDLLEDGCQVLLNCLVRKDEGGIRILTRGIQKLEDFIENTTAEDEPYEDIKKNKFKKRDPNKQNNNNGNNNGQNNGNKNWQNNKSENKSAEYKPKPVIESDFSLITISVSKRESIQALKSFLSIRQAKKDNKKVAKIFFDIAGQKIELPDIYIITKNDIPKLKNIETVQVELSE